MLAAALTTRLRRSASSGSGDVADRAGADAIQQVVGVVRLRRVRPPHTLGAARRDPPDRREPVSGDVVSDQAQVGLLALGRPDRLLGVVGLGAHLDPPFSAMRMPDARRRPIGDQQPQPIGQGRTTSSSVPPIRGWRTFSWPPSAAARSRMLRRPNPSGAGATVGAADAAAVVDDAQRDPGLGVPQRHDHVPRSAVPSGVGDRLARDPGHVLALVRRQVAIELGVDRNRDVEPLPELLRDRVERLVRGRSGGIG